MSVLDKAKYTILYFKYFKGLTPLFYLFLDMFSGKYSQKRVKVTINNYTLFLPLSAIREFLLYAGNNKIESFYVDTKENCIVINSDKIPINEIWGIGAYVRGWRFRNDVWVYKDVKLKHNDIYCF